MTHGRYLINACWLTYSDLREKSHRPDQGTKQEKFNDIYFEENLLQKNMLTSWNHCSYFSLCIFTVPSMILCISRIHRQVSNMESLCSNNFWNLLYILLSRRNCFILMCVLLTLNRKASSSERPNISHHHLMTRKGRWGWSVFEGQLRAESTGREKGSH